MTTSMEGYFCEIVAGLRRALAHDEIFTCWLSAEESDFVRFNHGKIRQAGAVRQAFLRLRLIHGRRQAIQTIGLTGEASLDGAEDRERIAAAMENLRRALADASDDPFLNYGTQPGEHRRVGTNKLTDARIAVNDILKSAGERDLVGLYAAGPMYRGFASSFAQHYWHELHTFQLDCSLYHGGRAVKTLYGGFDWSTAVLADKISDAAKTLQRMQGTPHVVAPGKYRAYLAPSALQEIFRLLYRGGFSAKTRQSKKSPLQRMVDCGTQLSPLITLDENTAEALAPSFQNEGFTKPPIVSLVKDGQLSDALVSPRTAKELSLAANGANTTESPEALDLAPGSLSTEEILKALDTGLLINNLWYLNFSDRAACRITGLTRYAAFWVERGVIKAPIDVMRFDQSLYEMFGDNLLALSADRHFLLSSSTYHERSTDSMRLPGALVKDLSLTL